MRIKSFKAAFFGLFYVAKTEVNFQIHLVAFLAALGMGIFFEISRMEWMILFVVAALVMAAELLNTAIEHLVDWMSQEYHPKAGLIKDIAAAGVFMTALGALCTGLFIFGIPLWHWLTVPK